MATVSNAQRSDVEASASPELIDLQIEHLAESVALEKAAHRSPWSEELIRNEFFKDISLRPALILGDNIFHGHTLNESLKSCIDPDGGTVFAYEVSDPERYGVVEFDDKMRAKSIEEKPSDPKSNYAVVGLYFYDNNVVDIAKNVKPSERGELEITSVNEEYLRLGKLTVTPLDTGDVWLDTGTIDSMAEASDYVRVLQKRTGQIIGSPEKAARDEGFVTDEQLQSLAKPLMKSGYGNYLV